MSTELIKKEIDGSTYEFEQFGAKQSLRVMVRLSKIIGKPLALASGVVKKDAADGDRFDSNVLAMAVESLAQNATEDEVLSLMEVLCAEHVLCDGKRVDFNLHYRGRFNHLFRVLAVALEVQYGDFFGALQGSLHSAAS